MSASTVDGLASGQRQLLVLLLGCGLGYPGVAARLGQAPGDVRLSAHAALEFLATEARLGERPPGGEELADWLLDRDAQVHPDAALAQLRGSEPARAWMQGLLAELAGLGEGVRLPILPAPPASRDAERGDSPHGHETAAPAGPPPRRARRFLRDNALSIFFGVIFLGALVGQALVGHADFNQQQVAHHGAPISFWRYVTSSSFAADVTENWQSEYLQFALYVLATVWFVQRGSVESKPPGAEGRGGDQDERVGAQAQRQSPLWARTGGLRTALYGNSLLLVMGTIWLACWAVQALAGHVEHNAQRLDHQQAPLTLWQYVGTPDFWNRTLQNWQSEFLAVGSLAIFAFYLRQRGSPESKPVGASHQATGES